ncbi:hypothetical protein FOA52_011037 [Chlamydomonas sp. UWO 241]|nr:hypothetical protein FOA52_011037 [Chlamydomonas sp. UWO 241]
MSAFIYKLALAFLEYKKKEVGGKEGVQTTEPAHVGSAQQGLEAGTSGRAGDEPVAPVGSEQFKQESLATYLKWLRCSRKGPQLSHGFVVRDELLLLRCEHWLEAADDKHRYGSNLRPYFDFWVKLYNQEEACAADSDTGTLSPAAVAAAVPGPAAPPPPSFRGFDFALASAPPLSPPRIRQLSAPAGPAAEYAPAAGRGARGPAPGPGPPPADAIQLACLNAAAGGGGGGSSSFSAFEFEPHASAGPTGASGRGSGGGGGHLGGDAAAAAAAVAQLLEASCTALSLADGLAATIIEEVAAEAAAARSHSPPPLSLVASADEPATPGASAAAASAATAVLSSVTILREAPPLPAARVVGDGPGAKDAWNAVLAPTHTHAAQPKAAAGAGASLPVVPAAGGKGEPAGGWQKVLEVVAATALQRRAFGRRRSAGFGGHHNLSRHSSSSAMAVGSAPVTPEGGACGGPGACHPHLHRGSVGNRLGGGECDARAPGSAPQRGCSGHLEDCHRRQHRGAGGLRPLRHERACTGGGGGGDGLARGGRGGGGVGASGEGTPGGAAGGAVSGALGGGWHQYSCPDLQLAGNRRPEDEWPSDMDERWSPLLEDEEPSLDRGPPPPTPHRSLHPDAGGGCGAARPPRTPAPTPVAGSSAAHTPAGGGCSAAHTPMKGGCSGAHTPVLASCGGGREDERHSLSLEVPGSIQSWRQWRPQSQASAPGFGGSPDGHSDRGESEFGDSQCDERFGGDGYEDNDEFSWASPDTPPCSENDAHGPYDLKTLSRNNFFMWLDLGDGTELDLDSEGVAREKLESQRVRYLTAEELPHYEVVVNAETGLLSHKLTGALLHTFAPGCVGAGDGCAASTDVTGRGSGGGGSGHAGGAARSGGDTGRPSAQEQQSRSGCGGGSGGGSGGGTGRPPVQEQAQEQSSSGGGGGEAAHQSSGGTGRPPAQEQAKEQAQEQAQAQEQGSSGGGGGEAAHQSSGGSRRPPTQQQAEGGGDGEAADQSSSRKGAVGAPDAAAASATTGEAGEKKSEQKWIWIVDPAGRLYVAAKIRGQFHHSSFLRGSAVMAAGNLLATRGRLIKLNADSGHYWPKPDHFRWAYDHLAAQGADLTGLEGLEFKTKHGV